MSKDRICAYTYISYLRAYFGHVAKVVAWVKLIRAELGSSTNGFGLFSSHGRFPDSTIEIAALESVYFSHQFLFTQNILNTKSSSHHILLIAPILTFIKMINVCFLIYKPGHKYSFLRIKFCASYFINSTFQLLADCSDK